MFYSHEILTSREHGVATVWLVATLGSKSNSKKINRKAITEVDVPKACRTIINPAAPMALRLQGNLLYGVSRVYLQQVSYVLSDAQNTYSTVHMMLRTVKNAALDQDAGKARPEQLILQDDPSFLPEFALSPPELLAELNLGPAIDPLRNGDSQSLDPSQNYPTTPERSIGGLVLPASSSVNVGEFVIHGDVGSGAIGGPGQMLGSDKLDDDPGFEFDDDGNLIDYEDTNADMGMTAGLGRSAMASDGEASARVRQEHEEGLQVGAQTGEQMDLDLPIFGDNLPDGEAFPTASQRQNEVEAVESSSPTVVAAARRKGRAARTIPLDTTLELRNKDLAEWNANYLQNMKNATRQKNQHRITQLAKKKAEYYVWGSGIGGIGARLPGANGPPLFDQFIGDNFFELFTGISRKGFMGTKRDRDSGIDDATQEESRRVRQKTEDLEDNIRRGQDDEAMFIPGGDDVELPREAPSALDDQHILSEMPWNITASIRSSSIVPRSARAGLVGFAGAPSSTNAMHMSRGRRMISTSPLHGRGQLGELDHLEQGEDDIADFGGYDLGAPGFSSDMPEVAFAPPNERIHEALSTEGENFLGFVADAIETKRDHVQAGIDPVADPLQANAAGDIDEVLFTELLTHHGNTRTIAAQALMMTLTLGTKSCLDVSQASAFGDINISLTVKGKIAMVEMQVEDRLDNRSHADDDVDDEGDEEDGQFEEQFATARAHPEEGEDDEEVDSLYED